MGIARVCIASGYKKRLFRAVSKELFEPVDPKAKKRAKCEKKSIFPVKYYANNENKLTQILLRLKG